MAKLNVEVGVNRTAFDRGLDAMRKQASGWASSMAGTLAGAFAIGSMVNWFNNFRTEMDRVAKLATRLGESTATIQRVGEAASMAGADIEMVVKAMSKLAVEAANGSDKFAALGISAQDFANASLEDKMLMLSAALEQANGDQGKMIALMDLLGARAQDLIPLLAAGPEALRQGFADASIVSDQVIRQTEKFNDSLEKLSLVGRSFFGWFIQAVATVGLGIVNLKDQVVILAKAMDPRNLFGGMSEAAQKFADDSTAAFEKFKRGYNEIWGDVTKKGGIKAATFETPESKQAEKDQEAEAKAVDSQAERLEERILQRKLQQMEVEDRIFELQQMQIELQTKMLNSMGMSNLEKLKIAEDLLDVEEQIARAQAEKDANDKRVAEEEAAEAEKKRKAEEDAAKAAEEEAPKTIEEAKKQTTVVSSSLQSVGGGGGAYVAMSTEARELQSQTNILRQIAANTSPQTQRIGGKQPSDAF